jgi:hypothetical protein
MIKLLVVVMLSAVAIACADEVPIAGRVTSIDVANRTLTVESAAKGKVRVVVIDVKPDTKIVRFARGADGKGFSEQPATLEDLKPGWTVSVKTHHHGDREVAELVRVVHEK